MKEIRIEGISNDIKKATEGSLSELSDVCKSISETAKSLQMNQFAMIAKQAESLLPTYIREFAETAKSIQVNQFASLAEKSIPLWSSQLSKQFDAIAVQQMKLMPTFASILTSQISDVFGLYSNIISDAFTKIEIPTISEERKKELIASHEAWGQFGWTTLRSAPDNFFDSCPDVIAEADILAMKYCRKGDMQGVFNSLSNVDKKIRKSVLEEAIFCYNNRKYRSCALILFGIIDSKLIRKQTKQEGNKRSVGIGAVKKFKEKIRKSTHIEETLFWLMDFLNISKCLFVMFEDSNDFCNAPSVVNRNFIAHGMNRQDVRKKDCVKLFLALDNLVNYL